MIGWKTIVRAREPEQDPHLLALRVVGGEPGASGPRSLPVRLQTRVVELRTALAVALGLVHREIAAAQEFFDAAVAGPVSTTRCWPTARGPAGQRERLRKGREDPLGGLHD